MILEYLRARYLRAPHDHWRDHDAPARTSARMGRTRLPEADDGDGSTVPDPSEQEVGPKRA